MNIIKQMQIGVKMKKAIKGTYGYINTRKQFQLLKSLALFSVVLVIFITGYIMNDNSKANRFTVLAILMVLPAAKMLVSYVILLPFHSVSKHRYDEVVSKLKESDILYTDMVITSKEKVMYLSFLVITDKKLIGLVGRDKENIEYIDNYLSTNMKYRGIPYTVTILDDEKKFLEILSSSQPDEENTVKLKFIDEEKELKAFLVSLMV